MDEIMLDMRDAVDIGNQIMTVSRAKAYQLALCIVSSLAMSDYIIKEGEFGALGQADDDLLPPRP